MHLMWLIIAAFLIPVVAVIRAAWVYGNRARARRAYARMEKAEAAAGGLTAAAWRAHWNAADKLPQGTMKTEIEP